MRRFFAFFAVFVSLSLVAAVTPAAAVEAAPAPATATVSGTVRYAEEPYHPVRDRATQGYTVKIFGAGGRYSSQLDENAHFSISGIAPGVYGMNIQFRTASWGLVDATGKTDDVGAGITIAAGSHVIDPRVGYSFHPLWPEEDRIAGGDRYETAVAVSRYTYGGTASTVFLASGQNFADALSAAPVAAHRGPLLLTPQGALPATVKAEIDRLSPSQVYVVGGPAAISDAVASAVGAPGRAVQRIMGADRFATSVALAHIGRGACSTAYIATGRDFPDALAVGARAGTSNDPVFLVDGQSSRLPAVVAASIREFDCSNIKIAGGTNVVSAGIENDLRAVRYHVSRFAGVDRWDTTRLITADRLSHETRHVFIASGLNFPDALAAAATVGTRNDTLYLAPPFCVPGSLGLQLRDADPALVTLVGGESVLSQGLNGDESWGHAC